jgi:hypothetical protein
MKKLQFIIFAVLCFVTVASRAQDFDKYISVSWDINMPVTNRSWLDATSARGYRIAYRKLVADRLLAGLDFGKATYSQYQPTVTMESPNGALTTDYFKYVYTYGLTLSGDYLLHVSENERILPYAGLGLGASYNSFNTYYNVYQDKEDKWGFLVSPRVGILFPFGRKVGASVGVHYDFSTAKSQYFGYPNFSNIGVQAGIIFRSY